LFKDGLIVERDKMAKNELKTCGTCVFGKPFKERIICRRFPPTCDGSGTKTHDQQPLMYDYDWCGEHKPTKPKT
jgi:hypothetical protein